MIPSLPCIVFSGLLILLLMILFMKNRKLSSMLKQHCLDNDSVQENADMLGYRTAILEAQLNSTTDGMIIVDESGDRILQNKRVTEIWKIPEEIQKSPDGRQQLHYVMQKTKDPDEFINLVNYLITNKNAIHRDIIELKDGTVLERYTGPVIGNNGKNYGRIWTFHEITEYKRVEQLLAAEKERLMITLRSIGDGVISTDIDGNILLINSIAQNLTGWKFEEAVGQPLHKVFNIIHEITHKAIENPVKKVLETGEPVELANHTVLLSKTGKEILIADSAAPIKNNENKTIGVVLVFRDITEKCKLQESIQKAQKIDSLGVLAGGIAHDFNNLLCGIFGFLEIARYNAVNGNTDKTITHLDESIKAFERARALTQQLLTFSKGGVPVLKTVCISELIKRCTEFALSGSNTKCQFIIDNNLWPCDCDEHQMEQVIDNLVINAKQAMPDGGTIEVSASNIIKNRKCKHVDTEKNRFIKISIKDTGIGIPKEALNKIFDPFYSTKEKGHGLGLATVFSIIRRHDGWIDVESEPGKGSIFHIYIPASSKNIECSKKTKSATIPGSGTILIMDDEEYIRKLFGRMLSTIGFETVLAKNGREAIDLFNEAEKSGMPYKACILDLTIPGGMGGKETVGELRKIKPDALLFAASGYSDDPVIAKPAEHGFTGSIVKPFTMAELSEFLGKWLS